MEFFERVKKINPAILEAKKDRFSFRINHHRAEVGEVVALLQKEGYSLQPVEWAEDVFTLPLTQRKAIVKTEAYTKNLIYIQNLSSIFAAYTLVVEPEDWVLDLAAAPGGKSLILSERAKRVSAVEPDKSRFFRMKRNFKEHGAKNIQTYNKDGRFIYKVCPEWFDKVFLDAPCSSEAHIDGEVTWWSMRRVRRFSKLQKELILSAFYSLKSGGEMIYATCTYSPEENEEVIDFLLHKEPNAKVLPIQVPFANYQEGMTSWGEKRYSDEVKKCVRILPKGAYSGFFMARLAKL